MFGRTLVLALALAAVLSPNAPSCTGTRDDATAVVSDAEFSRLCS